MKSSFLKLALLGLLAVAPAIPAAHAAAGDSRAPKKLMERWAAATPHPGAGLPGWYSKTPDVHVHQPRNLAKIPIAEIDLLRRRAMVAFNALMQQPSLRDVRGTSLHADINISVVPTLDGVRLVGATFTIRAKSVIDGDPDTIQRDGRYLTPSEEGAVLSVFLNPYDMMARRQVQAEGVQHQSFQVRTGSAFGVYVADRLPEYDPNSEYAWGPRPLALQLQHDRSWYQPGAAGVHPLLAHMSSYSHENDDLRSDRLSPERPAARLAAAMFMTDWVDVQRRMKETN
ncbi:MULTISPECIES: hypothetical protein [unclassified Sphingopyxis]|jgi:hypothetical protein|uniref:hypothetical protein n=1 Tax=unclassified Sphingopyxis TaxID=2614943 RepID=UPI0006C6D14E|nr:MULTISPECIES: hypothetical protein [unclassified Sphingopyxis]USI77211.1 hypothetical protein KEC45_21180 [Sphingopyxis sp. USTB-05]GAO80326.1 hypothetical protein SC1_03649 [Sphingopyxis sp. C-1]